MPTEQDNIRYLYLVLTHGGTPTIDWVPICEALALEKGAATKRWSRLKQAMEKGEEPVSANYGFLWLLVKHSTRDKPLDWQAIAEQCNSTKGACSKRYSRMKLSFERGDAPPSTAGKSAKFVPVTPKKTPKKSKLSVEDDGEDTPTATPKRKRTPAKKNVPSMSKPDGEEDDEEEALKSKHAKLAPKAKPKPKNSFRASDVTNVEAAKTVVKEEAIEDDGDVFTDAPELATEDGAGSDEHEYILPVSAFSEAFTHAREVANVLLNRKSMLTDVYWEELQDMLAVFGEAK